MTKEFSDKKTAEAFSKSWNNLPLGSIYSKAQFEDWMEPLTKRDVEGKRILELGCGSASLMVHMAQWHPSYIEGVELGDSVISAERNMAATGFGSWKVTQDDLLKFSSPGFDVVYCIGVLHHLNDPRKGFEAVISNTAPGGKFHCWVYAREGNKIVRLLVDPLRRVASRLPWWLTKYLIATPLAVPFFFYAKTICFLPRWKVLRKLPLHDYCLWIGERGFLFFRHVAFDQLVTPKTTYLAYGSIKSWLDKNPRIKRGSTYVILRNGNSWKFGGIAL